MVTFWIVLSGVYSAMFTFFITMLFRQSAENKLRAQHRQQLAEAWTEHSREARGGSLSANLPSDSSLRHRVDLDEIRNDGEFRRITNELSELRRRMRLLEAERKSGERDAA